MEREGEGGGAVADTPHARYTRLNMPLVLQRASANGTSAPEVLTHLPACGATLPLLMRCFLPMLMRCFLPSPSA